jgi:hypothetical protein
VSDNQGNGNYPLITGAYNPLLNGVPTVLDVASQVQSSQSTPPSFTLTCTSDHPDTINLFALEFADLGDSANLVDDTDYGDGGLPFNCGTLITSSVDDLIMSIYNLATFADPADVSPTLGTIPYCSGGQGGQCVAQNGEAYEVGGISTYTAVSTGNYTPAWNYSGGLSPMVCPDMALKVIGP